MKSRLYFLAAIAVLFSCTPAESNTPGTESNTPEETLPADPEFSVSGLPGSTVPAYTSFVLSVSSQSKGRIDFQSSRPDLAAVTLSGRRQYKVTVLSPEKETKVIVSFTQEADGNYPEVQESVAFTVLPDSTDSDETVPAGETHEDLDGVKVSFAESTELLRNPERGHYRARNIYSYSSPLGAADVKAQRQSGYTLWYLGFYLTDFMEGEISQDFLDTFQSSMDALREGGAKCVLRFAYKDHQSDKEEMDPEVDIVLSHVAQLKPYLQKNEDVIFVLQAGFVGPWGEWHSSTHFKGYESRKQLTEALMDALPVSRQIEVRTPQFKMRMYNLTVKDTITLATAHDGSVKSRLAGHNDCFGASSSDYGTFGNESKDREFWKADTRYTIMGGETCGVSDYCTCTASQKDLTDYHWTYLNKDYNTDVLNGWKKSGCYNNIIARLGYRLVMTDLFYSRDFAAGKPCSVTLRFYNTGYAAPMNPRDAVLVWVTPSGTQEETPLGSDPRSWQPGYHTVAATFTPSTEKGTLYLKLSDPLLRDRPEYSIALANQEVFDSATGMNKLFER